MTAIGVAVACTRPAACLALVSAVLAGGDRPEAIAVVFQGGRSAFEELHDQLIAIAAERRFDGMVIAYDPGAGCSRSRNIAIGLLPPAVDWVWTPNDTSAPPVDWIAGFKRAIEAHEDGLAVVGGQYVTKRFVRRDPPGGAISGWDLWSLIEPATLWRRQCVIDAGGFDERLGTGSPGLAQSGEGTDLIARLLARGGTVARAPVAIIGPRQNEGLTASSALRKEFRYAVGYGVVARRHFGIRRVLFRLPGPVMKSLARLKSEGETAGLGIALVRTAGRVVGLILGERATQFHPFHRR